MIIRVLRINEPPRQLEIEIHRVISDAKGSRIQGKLLEGGQLSAIESNCAELVAIAADLSNRWPDNARPRALALITDGTVLAFNPGRPEARSYSWICDHLTGQSPCAPIFGTSSKPFGIERMALSI